VSQSEKRSETGERIQCAKNGREKCTKDITIDRWLDGREKKEKKHLPHSCQLIDFLNNDADDEWKETLLSFSVLTLEDCERGERHF